MQVSACVREYVCVRVCVSTPFCGGLPGEILSVHFRRSKKVKQQKREKRELRDCSGGCCSCQHCDDKIVFYHWFCVLFKAFVNKLHISKQMWYIYW
jgi:hypothetical protein